MYITEEEVRMLCNKIGSAQVPDQEVRIFIEKAEARIDVVLGVRYALPLPAPVPPIVKSIASDFTAAFVIDKYYASIAKSQEQTVISDTYFKRADKDLKSIVTDGLLDRYPGIIVINLPVNVVATPCMKSTRRGKSPMEEALSKW